MWVLTIDLTRTGVSTLYSRKFFALATQPSSQHLCVLKRLTIWVQTSHRTETGVQYDSAESPLH